MNTQHANCVMGIKYWPAIKTFIKMRLDAHDTFARFRTKSDNQRAAENTFYVNTFTFKGAKAT